MQLRRAAGLRRLYLSTRARCSIRGDTGNAELKHFFNWKTNTNEELKKKKFFFNPPLDASRIVEIPKDVYLCVFHRHTTFRTNVRKLRRNCRKGIDPWNCRKGGENSGRKPQWRVAFLPLIPRTLGHLLHHLRHQLSVQKKACLSISQKVYLEPKWLR